MSDLTVSAPFTISGAPATGLTLTDISFFLTQQDKSTGADTTIWDGTQVATIEINNVGIYTRILATADLNLYSYFAMVQYIGATVLDSDYVYGTVGQVEADTRQIEGIDATDQIRDTILTDATRFAGEDIALIKGFIDTEIATLVTNVATILAAVVTEIADIKAKTDQLTFTTANKLDATIQAAGDFAQTAADKVWLAAVRVLTAGTNIVLAKGTGITGFNDLSAAQVNAEVDTALTNYDGPTHAELVSEINSVQADIAALNDISSAEVNAEVDTALTDYDAPTHVELVSEINSVQVDIAALNDISPAEVNSEVDQALADINLDHWVGTATAIPAVPSGTYLDQLMDDGTQVYDRATDSLQAIADNTGGEATLSAATLLAIAKAVLKKGITSMEDDGDFEVASIGEMILAHFESSIIEINPTTGSWIIRKVGGTTFNTRPVTLDATALPVKGVT